MKQAQEANKIHKEVDKYMESKQINTNDYTEKFKEFEIKLASLSEKMEKYEGEHQELRKELHHFGNKMESGFTNLMKAVSNLTGNRHIMKKQRMENSNLILYSDEEEERISH